jgi:phage shock protein C
MFCTWCGTHLAEEARYCTSCGKPTAIQSFPSQQPPTLQFVAEAPRRLYRNIAKKKIAGVCAGFADYFGMDITLMRLIWVGLLIMPPSIGLIAYVISWLVLPAEPSQ